MDKREILSCVFFALFIGAMVLDYVVICIVCGMAMYVISQMKVEKEDEI